MTAYIAFCLMTSFRIALIWYACQPGNILSFVRRIRVTGRLGFLVQKATYDCLPCMATLWTGVFACFEWIKIDGLFTYIQMILLVGGFNVLIAAIIGVFADMELIDRMRDGADRDNDR